MQTTDKATQTAKKSFRLKVTRRNTVTLPAELRQELGIEDGDTLDIDVNGTQAVLRKTPYPAEHIAYGRGLLRDYFKDHDDVMQFLEEERSGWEEREARLDEIWERAERRRQQSGT